MPARGTTCGLPALRHGPLGSWLVQPWMPGGEALNVSLTATLGQRNEPNLDPCLSAVCFVCLCFYKHGTPCVPSLDKGFLSRENQEKREEIRLDCLSYLNTRQSDNSIHCAHIPPTAQTERGGGGRHKSEVYQTINYVCERSGQTLY